MSKNHENPYMTILRSNIAKKDKLVQTITENMKKLLNNPNNIYKISFSISVIIREGKIYEYQAQIMRIFATIYDYLEYVFGYMFELKSVTNYAEKPRDTFLDNLCDEIIADIDKGVKFDNLTQEIYKYKVNYIGKDYDFIGFCQEFNTLFLYNNKTLKNYLSNFENVQRLSLGTAFDKIKKEFEEKGILNKELVF